MESKPNRGWLARLRGSTYLPWIIFLAIVVLLFIGAGLYLWFTRGLPILNEVLSGTDYGTMRLLRHPT
ncbi:hypothetical protein [Crystallibacter degradans]|uniref:hypothetical protein n=1 Tax=Crystallibacter degradans TaxID=2726743 RepID=UPI0014756EF3|nr:hypothetical protein [Arthrobacter sp. SF27]NMR31196.1 hypothetical protein [Arthrobacter sp. SF27]